MMQNNRLTQLGLYLIKYFQGLRLKAYLCPANVWTIGYGHTKNVNQGMVISEIEAQRLLLQDLSFFINGVSKATKGVLLTDNQFSALVSLAFNIGMGAFNSSTLLSKLKLSQLHGASQQFKRWNKITKYNNGKAVLSQLRGLTIRRYAQQMLFTIQDIDKNKLMQLIQNKKINL